MKLYSKEELLQLNKLKKGNEKAFEYYLIKIMTLFWGFVFSLFTTNLKLKESPKRPL